MSKILKDGDLLWYMTPSMSTIIRVKVHTVVNSSQVVISDLEGLKLAVVYTLELFDTISDCKKAAIGILKDQADRDACLIRNAELSLETMRSALFRTQKEIARIRRMKA